MPFCQEETSPSYDWSNLSNPREDVTVVVSLQPVRNQETLQNKQHKLIWPKDLDIIELTSQYRSTRKISQFNNSFCEGALPIESISIGYKSCETIQGPDVKTFTIENQEDEKIARLWIHSELNKLNCTTEQSKVLF